MVLLLLQELGVVNMHYVEKTFQSPMLKNHCLFWATERSLPTGMTKYIN